MKLFTIDKDGKFVPFKEQVFKEENKEIDIGKGAIPICGTF